ncbi:hypothetical protein [Halovivax sp.]|nr:hypothetical protein [Halovivax sp.]
MTLSQSGATAAKGATIEPGTARTTAFVVGDREADDRIDDSEAD